MVRWGDKRVPLEIVRFVERFPGERLTGQIQKDRLALRYVAFLARRQRIELLNSWDVMTELRGLPRSDDPRGVFFGAPITEVNDHINWGRVIAGFDKTTREHSDDFIASLAHPRFLELQRITGARQGKTIQRNQLLDAFHLWIAERAGADFFLTLDYKLVKAARRTAKEKAPKPECVTSTELVERLVQTRHARFWDVWPFIRDELKREREPSKHPYEDMVSLGYALEAQGFYEDDA